MFPAESHIVHPTSSGTPDSPRENQIALAPALFIGLVDGQIDLAVESGFGEIVQAYQMRRLWSAIGVHLILSDIDDLVAS